MEITGSELTTVLTAPARTKSRLISTVPRTPVFRALVNGSVVVDASTGSITDILYDTVTPGDDYLDIRAGMTIDIGTTPGGRERGSLRVRGITMGQIAVQETSPGMIDIQDNDYITVVEEYLPHLIPVRRVETLNAAGIATDFVEYHDYSQIYIDQNVAMPPKANIVAGAADDGQGYYLVRLADWADVGETYRTVTLSAVASKALAYGATLTSYLWDIGDCTLVSGTLTSTAITIEVPVGFRYVRLLVGDSNSKGHFMYLPLWTHDDTYPPRADFKVTGDDTEDGRSMRFEFYGADSSVSGISRNATIYYWKNTTFGRTADAAPRQYRQGALLWILSDATPLRHKRRGTYTITAGGAADWMKSVYGFPQKIMNPGDTPDTWYEMTRITGTRLLHYVLTTYTTLPNIVNVFYPDLTDEIEEFNTKAGTVWSQVVDIAKRSGYQTIGCDSQSGIWMKADYFFLNSTDRAARSRTLGLTPAHWPVEDPPVIPDEQTEDVGQVVGYGAAFDPTITDGEKNALWGARSPGVTHNSGKSRDTAPYQILPLTNSSTTLARWTGEYFARKNNRRKQVRVKLIHNLDVIEPCWNEPITITDTRGNLRGLVLNGDEFIVKKVSIRHNYEPRRPQEEITLTLEGVTTGNGGVSFYIPPPTITTSQPYVTYNPPPRPTFSGQSGLSGLIDRIACFDTNNQIHILNGLRQMSNGITPSTTSSALDGGPWTHTFDFTISDGGFSKIPSDNVTPIWTSGIGWEDGLHSPTGYRDVNLSKSFSLAYVTTITFTFSVTVGTSTGDTPRGIYAYLGPTLKASNVIADSTANGSNLTMTLNVNQSIDTLELIVACGNLLTGDPGGTAVIKQCVVQGTGTNPFTPLSGTLASFAVRADSPMYLTGTGTVNGYIATTAQVCTIADIFAVQTLGTPYAYAEGAAGEPHQVQLQTERGNAAWSIVTVYYDALGTRAYWTNDGSDSWSVSLGLPSAYDSNSANAGLLKPGLWLVPDGTGEALISAAGATGSPPGADLWRTIDHGENWTKVTSYTAGDYPCACIVKPFLRPDVLFFGYMDYTGGGTVEAKLNRIIGSTPSDISPSDGGDVYGVGGFSAGGGQRAISVADDDPNAVVLVGYNAQQDKHGVFQTWNGLAETPMWNVVVTPEISVPWRGVYYVSSNLIFLIGTSGWIGMLKYASGAWQLYAYQIPGGSTIVGICGG